MATMPQILDALFRAGQAIQVYRTLPDGLRRSHLYILHALEKLGGVARVTDIAQATLVKIPNLTRLLKETDAAGWTERSSDPNDKRTVMIGLTERGRAGLQAYYWDYLTAIADDLRPEEHPEFDVMITAIHQAVEAIERVTAAIDAN